MPWTSEHLKWLKDTGEQLQTTDGKAVRIWEFVHADEEAVLSAWAKHFRNHYCLDTKIDLLKPDHFTRAEYLKEIKFPDQSVAPGPSIRAGDFGEILVADYVQYVLGYSVPRTRYCDKSIRNESSKGCDVIGFKLLGNGVESEHDMLAVFEAKAQFSGRKPKPRLQDAIEGSTKDELRKAESLNAIKQRLLSGQHPDDAAVVARFQDPEDHPYGEVYGAVALFSTAVFVSEHISNSTTAEAHPHKDNLHLIVIRGPNMMQLVHELYRRATDEA
ncbi:MAG TPA: Hachiman antiphage defense system protein HamA [Anaerolineae bacterium]|nr:Hachiman antiphage defense system protein HamA [Anaerolineae bacterium]